MRQAQGGGDQRILAAYGETIDALYRYVSRHCGGDRALAEDVTQETWLRAVRDWRRKGLPDQPIAWLTTVARNLLASHYRRRGSAMLEPLPPDETLGAADDARAGRATAAAAVVSDALSRLPPGQADLLETFHLEDRRTADIARAAGVSARAVEGRLRRARLRLKRELESLLRMQGGTP